MGMFIQQFAPRGAVSDLNAYQLYLVLADLEVREVARNITTHTVIKRMRFDIGYN